MIRNALGRLLGLIEGDSERRKRERARSQGRSSGNAWTDRLRAGEVDPEVVYALSLVGDREAAEAIGGQVRDSYFIPAQNPRPPEGDAIDMARFLACKRGVLWLLNQGLFPDEDTGHRLAIVFGALRAPRSIGAVGVLHNVLTNLLYGANTPEDRERVLAIQTAVDAMRNGEPRDYNTFWHSAVGNRAGMPRDVAQGFHREALREVAGVRA